MLIEVRLESFKIQKSPECRLMLSRSRNCMGEISLLLDGANSAKMPFADLA